MSETLHSGVGGNNGLQQLDCIACVKVACSGSGFQPEPPSL